ncbi:hypothetical protein, partial [Roseivivax marinus]|uniref:hypothetical protein n=1 Tax=Roseivivax marinus TaxID=1379903 RepID=UPI001969F3B4
PQLPECPVKRGQVQVIFSSFVLMAVSMVGLSDLQGHDLWSLGAVVGHGRYMGPLFFWARG